MATTKHPYAPGSGGLTQAISQFRNMFPMQVNADTLKRLSIAPNNESYVINTLRFIGLIDAEGKRTEAAAAVFSKHDDAEFQSALADLISKAYSALFDLHGEAAWNLQTDKLISFFRNSDQTSSIVGRRQAQIFQALAALAGHLPAAARSAQAKPKVATLQRTAPKGGVAPKARVQSQAPNDSPNHAQISLAMRVEINLPVAADQKIYDLIFRSMKENLLNG